MYVVNSFVGFGINPSAPREATTRECESMRTFVIDNGEFQIAITWGGLY
jgi:hypothetical protein